MQIKRIMYVSHRYHTNQVPVMEGWHNDGVKVLFMAQYQGVVESRQFVDYYKMKPSWLTRIRYRYIEWKYDKVKEEGKKSLAFQPAVKDTYKRIKQFMPDIVILREYTLSNAIIYQICKFIGINKVIMYNQIPLFGYKSKRGKLSSFIGSYLFPHCCFSPVLYSGDDRIESDLSPSWYSPHYFVPLVSTPREKLNKHYFQNNMINVLIVGKYRDYKNHFFFVDAFKDVDDKEKFSVKIIGQLSNEVERDYHKRLCEHIEQKKLSHFISCIGNVPFESMPSIYANSDVLILPSKHESAGMVILEAMGEGLCVMSSNQCGLSCYLDKYNCGYVFDVKCTKTLTNQLNALAADTNKVINNGKRANQVVKEHFLFNNYKEALETLIAREYKV